MAEAQPIHIDKEITRNYVPNLFFRFEKISCSQLLCSTDS